MRALTLCLFLLITVQGQAEDGVRLSGRFTRLTFNGKGKPTAAWCSTNDFQIIVMRDGRYSIQVDSLGDTDSVYLTFDGADSYGVRYRSAVIGRVNNVIAKNPIEQNVGQSYISSGNYPFASLDELKRAHMLWLVFGSGNYIHSLKTNTMPLPFMSARSSMKAYGFRLEHELSAAPFYFPRHIRFIRDSKLDLSDNDEVNRPEVDWGGERWAIELAKDLRKRKDKYKNGFVRSEMDVTQFTNYNGTEVPLSFSLKGYSPSYILPRLFSKRLAWEAIGLVTNVTSLTAAELSEEAFLPPILSRVAVHDARFRYQDTSHKLNQINYGLELGEKWLPKDSIELQSINRDALKHLSVSARPLPTHARKAMIIMTAIFLIAAFAMSFFLYLKVRKKLNR